jgi:hypothetical protein
MWANAKPGRITIGRRDRFWVLSITQPGERWAEIIGIFSSQKSAQAEIDARAEWREHCKIMWKGV